MDLNDKIKHLSLFNKVGMIKGGSINEDYKKSIILDFILEKKNSPNLNKTQICKKLGISNSSLDRHMKDLNIKSFYRHNVPVSKHRATNTNRTEMATIADKLNEKPRQESSRIKIKNRKPLQNTPSKIASFATGGNLKEEDITDEYIDKLIK